MNVHSQIRFYKNWTFLIIITVIIVGMATAIFLYNFNAHSLYFYSDSVPHAYLARSYVDSTNPSFFEHLGTVWLPLPQLLLLPFTLIDPLFKNGFAGLFVSLPFHAVTSAILYKLIKRHVENPYIPIIGAFLYAINPNFLYLSLISMTEAPFMFFFVASTYFLQKWLYESPKNFSPKVSGSSLLGYIGSLEPRYLIISGIFASMATLCKYEAWFFSISIVIIAISVLIINNVKSSQKLARQNIFYVVFVFSIISFSGMIFWLIWNAYSFGDPLEFANNKIYSAEAQARLGNEYRSFLYHQPLQVLFVYGKTSLYTFGPLMLIVALLGFNSSTIFSNDGDKLKRLLVYFVLVVPAIFTIISLLSGVGEMNLDRWFNSRFLELLGPLIVLLNCMFLTYILRKIKNLTLNRQYFISVSIVVALFTFPIISSMTIVVTYANATKEFSDTKLAHSAGQYLGTIYGGNGTILMITDAGDISKIIVDTGVSLKHFVPISDSDLPSSKIQKPWLYTKYAVISKHPTWDAINAVKYWESNKRNLFDYYDKIYENGNFVIYVNTKK